MGVGTREAFRCKNLEVGRSVSGRGKEESG